MIHTVHYRTMISLIMSDICEVYGVTAVTMAS